LGEDAAAVPFFIFSIFFFAAVAAVIRKGLKYEADVERGI
jgi:hypothetical protein